MEGFKKLFIDGFGVETKYIWLVAGIVLAGYLMINTIGSSSTVFTYIFASAPIWLPILTFHLFFEHWFYYVRKEFDLKFGRTTIEIRIPEEIFKSPEAMELVLTQMYQTASPDNYKESYIDGKHPPTSSLELVSHGGDVRFYMNVPKKRFKDMWEVQLYAQYPGIEVHELDIDYTAAIPPDLQGFASYSFHMTLKKADAYPIKTYVDYGLDKMPKEEEKIDPINTVIEMLGSINPREHIWIQILIEANKEWTVKEGALGTTPDWKGAAREQIGKIIEEAAKRAGVGKDDIGKNINQFLTEAERDTIKAIERSLGKIAFNGIIRCMYLCPSDNVRIGDIVPRMITAWRVYDDNNRNSIGFKWGTFFEWPWWQDPSGKILKQLKIEELDEYKRRTLTPRSTKYGPGVFTTEELATIFHLPGKVTTTPTLGRIPSKRSEAPSNLPVG